MPISVTLLYGGMTALLVTLLGANVSRLRVVYNSIIGDPTPPALVRPIRAHGNAAEWVPVALLLLLLLELSGRVGSLSLHLLGGIYFLSRVLHAFGVYTKSQVSVAGATLNYLLMVIMSVWALVLHFSQ